MHRCNLVLILMSFVSGSICDRGRDACKLIQRSNVYQWSGRATRVHLLQRYSSGGAHRYYFRLLHTYYFGLFPAKAPEHLIYGSKPLARAAICSCDHGAIAPSKALLVLDAQVLHATNIDHVTKKEASFRSIKEDVGFSLSA